MPAAARRAALPVFISLRGYRRSWLRGDLLAALTVWAVLVPEALAYASIAGVPPVAGLYAAPGALLLYAALGGSGQLVVGPMAATAALSAAAVGDVAAGHAGTFPALTAALAVTTGMLALAAGVARLGFVASFISEPVLKGFIVGLALTIIVGQVPALIGVKKGSGGFFGQAWELVTRLGQVQWVTALVGLGSLAAVLLLRWLVPAAPAPLVAVAAGILAVFLLHLNEHGVAIVGHVSSGLPSFGLPDVPAAGYLKLAGPAAGIALVGFAEGLGAAKTYAAGSGQAIRPNRELIGMGAANLAAGVSAGMVVNGSLSKTAVNGAAGARSQLSGLAVAALTVLTVAFLTGLFTDLPEATLAAVVVAAVVDLVDAGSLRSLYRVYTSRLGQIYGPAARADFIAAFAALAGVLVFGTLPGLFLGITVSLLLLLYRAIRPHIAVLGQVTGSSGQWADVTRSPGNRPLPGVTVLRVESGLFFANADHIRAVIQQAAASGVRAIVLDCETVPFVDVTAARMLGDLAVRLRDRGVRLVVAREVGQVRDEFAATGGYAANLEYSRSVREAVDSVRGGASPGTAGGA